MRGRRVRRVVAGLAALGLAAGAALGPPRPAHASTISGSGEINATVTLTQWPCPFPSSCGASVSGGFRGVFVGLDTTGKPFTLTFPDPTAIPALLVPNLSMPGLAFSDNCGAVTWAPAAVGDTGSGDGSLAVTDGLLTRGASVSHGASLTGSIHFSRAGPVMSIGLSGAAVHDASNSTVASGFLGAGAVSFTVPAADVTASCDSVVTSSVNATIAGALSSVE